MLPGLDGLAVVTNCAAPASIPPVLLMISALSDVDARCAACVPAATTTLTKPFAPRKWLRVSRSCCAIGARARRRLFWCVGDLQLDLIARTAQRDVTTLELLPIEFRLLEYLMRNAGQVLTRTMIFEAVWGYHFDPGTNVIDVHIVRLRRKVDTNGVRPLIQTVRGCGYTIRSTDE
jgi:two-component system OmpR family response regulator